MEQTQNYNISWLLEFPTSKCIFFYSTSANEFDQLPHLSCTIWFVNIIIGFPNELGVRYRKFFNLHKKYHKTASRKNASLDAKTRDQVPPNEMGYQFMTFQNVLLPSSKKNEIFVRISTLASKGQLISKCLFGVFNFLQKTNKNKSHSSKFEFFSSFFGGNVGLKKSFRFCLTFKKRSNQKRVKIKSSNQWHKMPSFV